MTKTYNTNPFYRVKNKYRKYGGMTIRNHESLTFISRIIQDADIHLRRGYWKKWHKTMEYLEPKYGMKYWVYSPNTDTYQEFEYNEDDDFEVLKQYVLEGNVFV